MFTGIIEATGYIEQVEQKGKDLRLTINTGKLDLDDVRLGDSIAVNGVCLTVVRQGGQSFVADVSAESLLHTNIGAFKPGTKVNLEKALTLSTRLGGHLVSGHVDGIGTIVEESDDGRSRRLEVEFPGELGRFIAAKGSITVDGTSLTVTHVSDKCFGLNIVPHTQGETIIPDYKVGQKVHLEVDLIARYTERLLQYGVGGAEQDASSQNTSRLDQAFLAKHGFLGRS